MSLAGDRLQRMTAIDTVGIAPAAPIDQVVLTIASVEPLGRVALGDCSPRGRVRRWRRRHPLPSELHGKVSLHAAQALQTSLAGRGFPTSNPWLWIGSWQVGCTSTRFSIVSLPPWVRHMM
jgi:hypothetical protein